MPDHSPPLALDFNVEAAYEELLRSKPNILTTGKESLDLLIGIGLIAFVFGFRPLLSEGGSWQFILILVIIVSPAFILHELAHKYTAIRYGMYARFALMKRLAGFSLLAGFIGLRVAGPGATIILGKSDKRKTGIFSVAGPITNFLLGGICYFTVFFTNNSTLSTNLSLHDALYLATFVNSILALFNLIPIGILDGKKIMAWNPTVWFFVVLPNVVLLQLVVAHI